MSTVLSGLFRIISYYLYSLGAGISDLSAGIDLLERSLGISPGSGSPWFLSFS